MKSNKGKKLRITGIIVLVLIIAIVAKFFSYVNNYYQATDRAMEYINTDVKNKAVRRPKQMRKLNDLFQVTPLLILEVIVLAIIIWMVSFASVTLPYRNSELINDKGIFETATIQEKLVNALAFYPIRIQTNKSAEEGFMPVQTTPTQATEASTESLEETTTTNNQPAASLAETTVPGISATSG